ncbi:hypothetical protein GCE86_11170 [Micromonospora terminaliae]|uniref:Uncharacterized protein n=1 Tax=Micromonospora terminaliae TaxID=1914461 RepID=A0AAJ2ZCT3_9ACTN|nr:hypothetical protein [Micromonospora terminaliae]NES27667.1 hypothetical protein [Micromonospora terminaliae]QGL47536.1 hypothetical protein GCE86_11170 [Micromonospora terminaliae]
MPAAATEDPAVPSRAPLSRAIPSRRHLPLAALLVVYLAARLLILTRVTVFISADSASYAGRPPASIDALSFTGHAPRPWGVPLLYALAGTDHTRVVLQWGIGTLAWALLVCACWLWLRSLAARLLAATALIVLALARSVYSWDEAILSEALTISLGVAALALLIIWTRTRSRTALVALTVTAFWWTFTRPDVLPYVLLLTLALAASALRRHRRAAAAGAVAALLAGLTWQSVTVPTIDQSYRSWGSGLSLSEATFVYRLRFQILADPAVRGVYQREFGMPRCERAEQIAQARPWAMAAFIDAYRACPPLVEWTQREKGTVSYRYVLAEPGQYADSVVADLPTTLGGTAGRYGAAVPGVPAFPERILFPRPSDILPRTGVVLLVCLTVGLAAGAFRRARWPALTGLLTVAASAAGAVAGMLYSAGEYGRFGIQEAVFLRIGLILLAAAAIEAVAAVVTDRLAARRRPAPPGDDPTGPGTAPPGDDPTGSGDGPSPEPTTDVVTTTG